MLLNSPGGALAALRCAGGQGVCPPSPPPPVEGGASVVASSPVSVPWPDFNLIPTGSFGLERTWIRCIKDLADLTNTALTDFTVLTVPPDPSMFVLTPVGPVWRTEGVDWDAVHKAAQGYCSAKANHPDYTGCPVFVGWKQQKIYTEGGVLLTDRCVPDCESALCDLWVDGSCERLQEDSLGKKEALTGDCRDRFGGAWATSGADLLKIKYVEGSFSCVPGPDERCYCSFSCEKADTNDHGVIYREGVDLALIASRRDRGVSGWRRCANRTAA